jgi:pimeloyl-ACP methyl ester carboxylesterase
MKLQLDDTYANVEISGDGCPLVLLHGSFCNTLLWEAQAELAERLTLAAVDLRGHGGTPCPVTVRSLDRPLDIIQVMDGLGIDRAFFCGLSMGGPIALDMALNYPERCLGTILLATGPGPGDRPLAVTKEMKDSAERAAAKLVELGPVQYFYSTSTAEAPGVKEFLEKPEQRAFFDRMLAHNNAEWLADWFRLATLDVPPGMEKLLTSHRIRRLPELTGPVLFMVGGLDRTFLPVAALLKEKVAHCEIEVVPRASHLINIDAKDIVNARVVQFLEDVMGRE